MSLIKNLLVVDDSRIYADSIAYRFEDDANVYRFYIPSIQELKDCFAKVPILDIAVIDLLINGITGMDILRLVKQHYPDCMVIIVTGCDPNHMIFKEAEAHLVTHPKDHLYRKLNNDSKLPLLELIRRHL